MREEKTEAFDDFGRTTAKAFCSMSLELKNDDDYVAGALHAASVSSSSSSSSLYSCPAHLVTHYLAKRLVILNTNTRIFPNCSTKWVMEEAGRLVGAILEMQKRICFCESIFRHLIRLKAEEENLALVEYGIHSGTRGRGKTKAKRMRMSRQEQQQQEEDIEERKHTMLSPIIAWCLSRAGILCFKADYLSTLNKEQLRVVAKQLLPKKEEMLEEVERGSHHHHHHPYPLGEILAFLVQYAGGFNRFGKMEEERSGDFGCHHEDEDDDGSLQVIDFVRDTWRGGACVTGDLAWDCSASPERKTKKEREERCVEYLDAALRMTEGAFTPALLSSFWMNEVCFYLCDSSDKENHRSENCPGIIPDAFKKICCFILPKVAVDDLKLVLEKTLTARNNSFKVEWTGYCIGTFLEARKEEGEQLQALFLSLGRRAIEELNARLFSDVILCNQKSYELVSPAASSARSFQLWLKGFLQGQLKQQNSSGFIQARVTQFVLKVFNDFVPNQAPEMLRVHKEVMKTLDGLNESYVRDYCNLVQCRLNDFHDSSKPTITEEGRQEVVRQMEAFRNGNNRIGNSVLIKARMWRQSWWCNVVVPALLERPEGEKEQELREKYIEALVSEKLLVAKDLSDFRKACGIKGNAPKSETKTRFSVIDQTCPFCCLSMSVSEKEFARHIGNCMGSFDDF